MGTTARKTRGGRERGRGGGEVGRDGKEREREQERQEERTGQIVRGKRDKGKEEGGRKRLQER